VRVCVCAEQASSPQRCIGPQVAAPPNSVSLLAEPAASTDNGGFRHTAVAASLPTPFAAAAAVNQVAPEPAVSAACRFVLRTASPAQQMRCCAAVASANVSELPLCISLSMTGSIEVAGLDLKCSRRHAGRASPEMPALLAVQGPRSINQGPQHHFGQSWRNPSAVVPSLRPTHAAVPLPSPEGATQRAWHAAASIHQLPSSTIVTSEYLSTVELPRRCFSASSQGPLAVLLQQQAAVTLDLCRIYRLLHGIAPGAGGPPLGSCAVGSCSWVSPCCAVSTCAVLCCAVLCCAVLCCAVLHVGALLLLAHPALCATIEPHMRCAGVTIN
jgi:hypothetical protein